MKLIKLVISIAFFMLLFSCNKTTGPVLPDVTTTEAALKNLRVSIIGSDSLIIRNGDNLFIDAMDVIKISVFEEHEDSLVFLKTITPSYKNVGSLLTLEFLIPIKVIYPDYDKSFVLQYNMSDDTILEVKTYAHMYKYPYGNAELWFRFANIGSINPYGEARWTCAPQFTLDFEINNDNFYFNNDACGAWGISKYNFNSRVSEYVSNIIWEDNYPEDNGRGPLNTLLYKPHHDGGIFLAVDEDYLFYQSSGGIFRINLLTETTSLFIKTYEEWGEIKGIEAANDTLYLIVENKNLSNNYDLIICNYDGELLNNISLPVVVPDDGLFPCKGLELYEGILYIWNREEILRLNLSDLVFLTPLIAPQNRNNGFDIHNDILYFGFIDIYWLELSELREVE